MILRQSGRALADAVLICALMIAGSTAALSQEEKCPEVAGISLPKGFCATVFADKIGHARQMAIAPDGTLYVNTWSGAYYQNDTPPEGGFLVALKDTKSSGKADVVERFGPTFAEEAKGGTGLWRYKNWLYAEIDDRIVRYELKQGETAPSSKPETILSGLPLTGDHPMHPFAIDDKGTLFVTSASATNACEAQNRMPRSPGNDPCKELDTRGGVWRYDANKTDQVFSPKERYASGIRNPEGYDFDSAGRLYMTQHGRDQLHENWPELYSQKQGFELPAEQIMILKEGAPIMAGPSAITTPSRRSS
jgi:glucose/arabinose dehydrogenase